MKLRKKHSIEMDELKTQYDDEMDRLMQEKEM